LSEAVKKRALKSSELISKYKRVFNSTDGQAVLYDLCKVSSMLKGTFVAGDPYESAWREGQREVVLRIARMLRLDEKKYLEQMRIQEEMNYE
jgi:hypothetical protein